MRACEWRGIQVGDWITLGEGLYAGREGRVAEVRPVVGPILRVRLEGRLPDDYWRPLWDEPMTEWEWLHGKDTAGMERHLRSLSAARGRKARLYACACLRRLWPLLPGAWRQTIELGEDFADGLLPYDRAQVAFLRVPPLRALPNHTASRSLLEAVSDVLAPAVNFGQARTAVQLIAGELDEAEALRELLREVFGNPFRPAAVAPDWLRWQAGTVPALARRIYDERRFEDMPVLGDALEDAGCADEALLAHCRSASPHARGCWLLDSLLGLS
jgi:hypothetical protein